MGESISINTNKTAFHRPRRLDPRVILDSVKVTISTTHGLPEGWSFEILVAIVLCIAMDFSSSLALSFKPGMLHMQNSLLPGSSQGFADFFCRALGKGKSDIFDGGWSQIFAYLCNPPLPHLAVWPWWRKPAALGEQISWASLVSKFNLLCCVNISDLSGALERLTKVSKEQRSMPVWLLPFWSQWMAVCALHLPIPLGSCQGASVSVCFNYWSSANPTSSAVTTDDASLGVVKGGQVLCVW